MRSRRRLIATSINQPEFQTIYVYEFKTFRLKEYLSSRQMPDKYPLTHPKTTGARIKSRREHKSDWRVKCLKWKFRMATWGYWMQIIYIYQFNNVVRVNLYIGCCDSR